VSDEREVVQAAARLERAVEEAHSRYAGAPESERTAGIATALRQALAAEPESLHSAALEQMVEWYPLIPVRTDDPALAAELAELRGEVARLRQQKSAEPAPAPAAAPIDRPLLEALLGRGAEKEPTPAAERVVGSVRALASLASDLARAFLAVTAKAGETALHADRFRTALRAELAGAQPGALQALLDEIKLKVAGQLEAFPTACADGARQILKELDPLLMKDAAEEKKEGVRLPGGLGRVFQHREWWEAFERRYAELVSSDDLYQAYFDGPLRRALYRLKERK